MKRILLLKECFTQKCLVVKPEKALPLISYKENQIF
jgi:hypothetical protein